MEFGFFARIAPFGVDEPLGDFVEDRRLANLVEVLQAKVFGFADDPRALRERWADKIRGQHKFRIVVEFGGELLFGQLDTVAFDARKSDFEVVSFGPHGFDLDRISRLLDRSDHRLGRKVERDPEHVGVFDIEEALFVQFVRLASEGSPDDLFAQQLGTKGSDPQDVGHGVGVPTFGEHRDRDDAADRATELARFSDRVHHFAQELLVREVLAGALVAGPFDDLASEAFDFVASHLAKVRIERIVGFELLAIDQQGVGTG